MLPSVHRPFATIEDAQTDTYQITVEDGIAFAAPTTSRDIKRHKAFN